MRKNKIIKLLQNLVDSLLNTMDKDDVIALLLHSGFKKSQIKKYFNIDNFDILEYELCEDFIDINDIDYKDKDDEDDENYENDEDDDY